VQLRAIRSSSGVAAVVLISFPDIEESYKNIISTFSLSPLGVGCKWQFCQD
jgi:hypothetical protein